MQQWNDYPIESSSNARPESTYVPVEENGYGLLTAWAAGPTRSFRRPALPSDYRPSKVTTTENGTQTTYSEQRTQRDQDTIDDTINEFLAEAGVPPIPSGFHWYVQVPAAMTGNELTTRMSAANEFLDAPSVAQRIAQLYEQTQQ